MKLEQVQGTLGVHVWRASGDEKCSGREVDVKHRHRLSKSPPKQRNGPHEALSGRQPLSHVDVVQRACPSSENSQHNAARPARVLEARHPANQLRVSIAIQIWGCCKGRSIVCNENVSLCDRVWLSWRKRRNPLCPSHRA